MTPLWTAAAAECATAGRSNRDWTASGVSIDSRTVAPGDLFVALAGPRFDGHDYAAQALAKGAAAAVVSRVPENVPTDAPLLRVADTQAALEGLGAMARRRTGAVVVGVTGSVGKTGTKEALRRAFERQGASFASAGSLNNQWGVPLSLARMPRETVYGVFEMGMNHPGEIDALTRLVRPHVAVITTVEPAHLGFFPSVEAIADAKAEIFAGVEPGGSAILNRDNPHFARLERAAHARSIERIIGFGAAEAAEARLLDCRIEASGSAVQASILGETVGYSLPVAGRHWVMNSLAVLAAVKALGADLETAAAALARMPGLPGRGLRRSLAWKGGSIELIDESYNANPASMRAAIAVLGATSPGPGGRRIAVLGEMRELGSEASRLHAELAAPLAASGIDLVFTVGEEMAHLQAALP